MPVSPKGKPNQITLIDSNRHQWISVAAYYKSELRKFLPGKELNDWLAAENEYRKFQIKSFLVRCNEDGGMSVLDLQRLAYTVGVTHPELINTKKELIRAIQNNTQHSPCFQPGNKMPCDYESDCEWQSECRKLIAVWYRQNE